MTVKKISVLILGFICLFYMLFIIKSVSVIVLFILTSALIFRLKSRLWDAYLGFFIGLIITFLFYEYSILKYGNPYYLGINSDDFMFENSSLIFYNDYGLNFNEIYNSIGILHNSAGYVYFISLLRFFGDFFDGYHTLLPRICNILILQLLAHFIFLKGVKDLNIADSLMKKSSLIFSVFPSVLFISQYVFRDIIVSFLIFIVYFFLSKNKKTALNIIIALFSLVLLFFFRMNAFYILIVLSFFYFLNVKKINIYFVLSGLFILFLLQLFVSETTSILNTISTYDTLNSERLGTIGSAIFSLPKTIGIFPRISFLLLNPIIGFSSLEQFISSFGMIFQILFIPFLLFGIINNKLDLKLKITFLVIFLGVALSTVNFRHITMYIPFSVLIISYGIQKLKFFSPIYNNILIISLIFISLTILLALAF